MRIYSFWVEVLVEVVMAVAVVEASAVARMKGQDFHFLFSSSGTKSSSGSSSRSVRLSDQKRPGFSVFGE